MLWRCKTCGRPPEAQEFTFLPFEMSNGAMAIGVWCYWCDNKLGHAKIRADVGEKTIPFGIHKGKKYKDIPKSYLEWCFKNFEDSNVKKDVEKYLGQE